MLAGLAALADDQMNCPGGPLRKRGRHAMIRLGTCSQAWAAAYWWLSLHRFGDAGSASPACLR